LVPQSFWEDQIHPDDKGRILAALEEIKIGGSGGLWEQEYRFRNGGGVYMYVQDRGKLIHDTALGNSKLIGTTRDISERKILEKELAEERLKKTEQSSVPILEAQENERFEIASELYENLGQILCAAKMHVELANVDEEKKVEYLKTASAYIMDVIQGIRSVARKLRMPGMNLGLFDSIRSLMDSLNEEQQTIVEFQVFGLDENDLDETLQLDIFRIVQELVNNISIHSGATEALITLTRNRNEIALMVLDNGQGCDLMKVETGMGIANISALAQQYNRDISVISSHGAGYCCKIVLPISGRQNQLMHYLDDYDD
jgi:signal transduction histidine kinase